MQGAVGIAFAIPCERIGGSLSLIYSPLGGDRQVITRRYLHEEASLRDFLQVHCTGLCHLQLIELELGTAVTIAIDIGSVGLTLLQSCLGQDFRPSVAKVAQK